MEIQIRQKEPDFGPRIKRHSNIAGELTRENLISALNGFNSMSKHINPEKPAPVDIAGLSGMAIEELRILYTKLTSGLDV
jgi:hypothetical protein